ncbi:MAG: biotin--[acetyl-CoA-carboxylase] ligase [Chloroflexi bacterium]|nr:biotin--[acetyl-CoA-carboxylase] ligase [Chloroflexota bacterium]MCL5273156.1 biotin--[acetyl-CoA-carboxylase] ligase [Chloroflexota bacterium]
MRYDIRRLSRVTSTMDATRDLAEQGAPEGAVVTADEQTAGRGRSTHAWYSPPGQSLYASIVLRPALKPAQGGWITMIAALAVRDCIVEIGDWRLEIGDQSVRNMTHKLEIERTQQPRRPTTNLQSPNIQSPIPNLQSPISNLQSPISNLQSVVSIKWFNDVLMRGRKVCGILVESSITAEQLDYAILGIGLNVNTRFDEAPPEVRERATSLINELRDLCGDEQADVYDREDVLQRLLARFGERYDRLMSARASPALEYAAHVETLGRDVRVSSGSEIISGRALRIGDDGALIVQTDQGERRVGFGDVL